MDCQRPRRAGFTLIELLMVIVIIASLIAILVPTVFAALRRAKEAQVSAEMSNLATALASFRNTYGDYPPSRILLCESGYASLSAAYLSSPVGYAPTANAATEAPFPTDNKCTDLTHQQLKDRSLLYLRKFWPRADFVTTPAAGGMFNDFDGDGLMNANPIVISGSECLAFFLGGIPIRNNGAISGLSGFSKSPKFPFVSPAIAQNRTAPNYEFNNGRLIDQDGDHIPSYIDPVNATPGSRRAYAYFSSYGTNGYDPNDVNGYGHIDPLTTYEFEEDGSTYVERGFAVGFPVYDSTGTLASLAVSPGPNPYTSGPPATGNVSWFNGNSFQILAAGADGYWGLGGTYHANGGGAGRLPILANAADPGNIHSDDGTGVRLREADNLSNFGGRLD